MTDINDLQLEIKAVKFALRSFAKYENDGDGRRNFLRDHLDTEPGLETYCRFSEEKLQDALIKLQDAQNKLQDTQNKLQGEKNLLLAQQRGINFILLSH